jgi:hypothetical protein
MFKGARFAFHVWRIPYVVGCLGIALFIIAAWRSLPLSFTLLHFILYVLEWTLFSSVLFCLAWLAKYLSFKKPILIFSLPIAMTGITAFFTTMIFSFPREGMGQLAVTVVSMMFGLFILPGTIMSWAFAIREFKK